MKMRHLVTIIVLLTGISATVSPAYGQKWSKKQLEVWKVVEASWKAEMEKEDWGDTYLHEKALVWSDERPMPRDKSSARK